MDGGGPALSCMKQLFPCALGEITDSLLGNPILEMCVYAAEGESLLGHLTCCLEIIVCKTAFVTVIMLDANAVLLGKSLKGTLGFDGLLGCE